MGNKESLRDQVLAAVPAASHTAILKMALDQHINDPNDPHWGMVALAWAATDAANISRESLESVRRETGKIPEAIYQGAVRAGTDLAAQVRSAGDEAFDAARGVVEAAKTSAEAAINKATQGLATAAERQCEALVKQMAEAAAKAAQDAVHRDLVRVQIWEKGMIAALIAFGVALGMFLANWLNSPAAHPAPRRIERHVEHYRR